MNNKLKAYLGFAIKSNGIVFGFDNLCETKKKIVLVVTDSTINPKVHAKLQALCDFKKWKIIQINSNTLFELLGRNCKVVGITDNNLAKAIMDNIN